MRIANESLITSPENLSANKNYRAIWIGHIVAYSIHIKTSGTGSGSFKLQACIDDPINGEESGLVNWVDISGSSQSITGGDQVFWNVDGAGYSWVRVVYTHTSGTITVTSARFNLKGT